MGFAITSAVFGGITIICYSIAIASYNYWYYGFYGYSYQSEMAITAIILILGITEFAIGIWAATLCCMFGTCNCCGVASNEVKYEWNTKTQWKIKTNIICCNLVQVVAVQFITMAICNYCNSNWNVIQMDLDENLVFFSSWSCWNVKTPLKNLLGNLFIEATFFMKVIVWHP